MCEWEKWFAILAQTTQFSVNNYTDHNYHLIKKELSRLVMFDDKLYLLSWMMVGEA